LLLVNPHHRFMLRRLLSHLNYNEVEYHDLDADFFNRLEPGRLRRYLIKRLQSLGYDVTLKPKEVDGQAA
jgi:hypothetical protein